MSFNNVILQDLLSCVQFLSRLPVANALANHDEPDFARSSRMFPLAGLLITLPATGVMVLLSLFGLPAMVIAAMVIATQLMVTGALHEDGLADCADGFGGGQTVEDKLAIMKDSRIGAFGVAALIMAFVLRFALLVSLINISLSAAILAYLAAQMLSRTVQVYFWHSLPAARSDGLASTFGQPNEQSIQVALAVGIISALTLSFLAFKGGSIFIGLIITLIAFLVFRAVCQKQIKGQTGDTLGAMQVIAEIAFLIGLLTFIS